MAETSSAPEWRMVQDFPDYEVSSDGAIRCLVPYRLKQSVLPPGSAIPQHAVKNRSHRQDGSETIYERMYAWLRCPRRQKKVYLAVSRVVCRAFHGDPPPGRYEAAHNNGIPTDNRSENLRWATPSENQLDRRAHGTSNAGENHGASRLTNEMVIDIRRRLFMGERVGPLANEYGLLPCKVSQIRAGHRWAHLIADGEPVSIPSRRRLPNASPGAAPA